MKFIAPLSEEERVTLREMYMNHPSFHCRQRAHAVLLNARGYRIP
jgi:hypothetical protein